MQSPSPLIPGYKHVEAFASDEEYESGEEVCYVTIDVGAVEPMLVPSSSSYRLIGLDTPTPFLQLQGTIFKGRHDTLLGTEMLFTDDKESHDRNKRSITHVANTERRIAFKEVTLIPKQSSSKGKERAYTHEGPSTSPGFNSQNQSEASSMIDRMTGLTQPPRRAAAKKKPATQKPSRKGKGRAKGDSRVSQDKQPTSELEPPPEDVLMQGTTSKPSSEVDDMEDMYMDF